ncbi:ATP-binding protein [Ideonella sp. B508-1]|uniref:ATP-binding protein n=1 Tax=Ideonella sp. B508-1 TaxID=137716 RepID=UPI000345B1CA|nr:ATP-binding protein [Ideonella sp. B508-1]
MELRIKDNGCGFAPDRASRGLGLLGASERAPQLGGDLSTGASPLGGAPLCLRVPVWPVAEGAR